MCTIYLLVFVVCTALLAGSFPHGIHVSELGKSSPPPETIANYSTLKRAYISQEYLENRGQGVEACRDAPQNYPVQGRSEEGGNLGKWKEVGRRIQPDEVS